MLTIGARDDGVAGTRRRAEIAYIGGSPSLSTGVKVCIRVYTDHNGAPYNLLLVLEHSSLEALNILQWVSTTKACCSQLDSACEAESIGGSQVHVRALSKATWKSGIELCCYT
jgi:hypothetical protein